MRGNRRNLIIIVYLLMVILLANVILRFIPGIGGFKWYMEGGQYLNVFSMLIAGIGITARRTHLHVELVDAFAAKNPKLKKIHGVIVSLFVILFYAMVTYGGWQLASVSPMPQFTMGQVYRIFPIAGAITVVAAIVDMIVLIMEKEVGGEKK